LSLLFEADLFADCFRQFFQNAFVPDKHSFDRVQVLLYSVKRFPRFCKVNQKLGLILDKHSHRRFQIAVAARSSCDD